MTAVCFNCVLDFDLLMCHYEYFLVYTVKSSRVEGIRRLRIKASYPNTICS